MECTIEITYTFARVHTKYKWVYLLEICLKWMQILSNESIVMSVFKLYSIKECKKETIIHHTVWLMVDDWLIKWMKYIFVVAG